MEAICAEVTPIASCNMLFNLLCDYALNLNNFVASLNPERRLALQQKMVQQIQVNPHYNLYKRSFITFLRVYIEEDPDLVLTELGELETQVKAPGSSLPSPSYVEIMIKFFQVNLNERKGET